MAAASLATGLEVVLKDGLRTRVSRTYRAQLEKRLGQSLSRYEFVRVDQRPGRRSKLIPLQVPKLALVHLVIFHNNHHCAPTFSIVKNNLQIKNL